MLQTLIRIVILGLCFHLRMTQDFGFDLLGDILDVPGRIQGQKYVYVGGKLLLKCSLETTSTGYTSKDIKFGFAQPKKSDGQAFGYLPSDLVHPVNTTTAELVLPVTGEKEQGQYNCYVGSENCSRDRSCSMVDTVDVEVEYPVQNVTDFRCVVSNWATLKCTWQHSVRYLHPERIDVDCVYAVKGSSGQFKCPTAEPVAVADGGDSLPRYTVRWADYAGAAQYFIEMKVTDQVTRDNASKVFPVHTFDIVKPAPVYNLNAAAILEWKGCILVTWSHDQPRFQKYFRVTGKRMDQENNEPFKSLTSQLTTSSFQHCGYGPSQVFQFRVDVHPSSPYDGFWSEPSNVSFLTPETAPSLGPELTNGSYVEDKCHHGARRVTLFWKEVPHQARNGRIVQYIAESEQGETSSVQQGQFLATLTLPCEKDTEVKVFAVNSAGRSLVPSRLIIPSSAKIDVPGQVTDSFAIEIPGHLEGSNRLRAVLRNTWEAEASGYQPVRNMAASESYVFTVFWCPGLWKIGKCEGPISWLRVPDGSIYVDIPLHSDDYTRYLFGLSVMDRKSGFASPIYWASCLASKGNG